MLTSSLFRAGSRDPGIIPRYREPTFSVDPATEHHIAAAPGDPTRTDGASRSPPPPQISAKLSYTTSRPQMSSKHKSPFGAVKYKAGRRILVVGERPPSVPLRRASRSKHHGAHLPLSASLLSGLLSPACWGEDRNRLAAHRAHHMSTGEGET